MLQMILVGMGFMGLFFVLMSVKLIFKKDGKFEGTCASKSPFLNAGNERCSYCGNDPNECKRKSEQAAS